MIHLLNLQSILPKGLLGRCAIRDRETVFQREAIRKKGGSVCQQINKYAEYKILTFGSIYPTIPVNKNSISNQKKKNQSENSIPQHHQIAHPKKQRQSVNLSP